jgi:hypothetical protein
MKTLILFLAMAVTLQAATPAAKEIESLLNYLGGLDGAVFIRNGGEHTAKEAEAHVRMKWEKQAPQIKTTEDFITLCASQSSLSSTRYEIRLKDGRKVYADDLLKAELARMRAPKK